MQLYKELRRANSGQSIVELVAGLIALIPVIMALLDIAVVYSGISLNDSICRDAARVAAAGDPTNTTQMMNRATQVIKNVYKPGGYVVLNTTPKQVIIDPSIPFVAPNPTTGGTYNGNILVQTEVTVNLPASVPNITPSQLVFDSQASYPITFVAQPASGSIPL